MKQKTVPDAYQAIYTAIEPDSPLTDPPESSPPESLNHRCTPSCTTPHECQLLRVGGREYRPIEEKEPLKELTYVIDKEEPTDGVNLNCVSTVRFRDTELGRREYKVHFHNGWTASDGPDQPDVETVQRKVAQLNTWRKSAQMTDMVLSVKEAYVDSELSSRLKRWGFLPSFQIGPAPNWAAWLARYKPVSESNK